MSTNNFTQLISSCSFCGVLAEDSLILVRDKNNKVAICKECIDKCHSSVKNFEDKKNNISKYSEINHDFEENEDCKTPLEILEFFDEYIIGQNRAKKILSVAAYNHMKKLKYEDENEDEDAVEIEKSNILLIGETGTGKTLFSKTLSKIMNVPMVIVDATSYTQAGYVGEDVENAVARLYQQSGYDIEQTERGIICIDEIDKTTRKTDGHSPIKDVSGEGVQQALLKLLEGTIITLPAGNSAGKKGLSQANQQQVKIDTKNILFICSGSFEGLDQVVLDRISGSKIGFNADIDSTNKLSKNALKIRKVNSDDLIKYGLIPEFVARIPVLTTLDPLSVDNLIEIMSKPRNALIKQYEKLFELDGAELKFEKNALEKIADWAFRKKNGARGLRSIMENILLDYMFDLPRSNLKKILITSEIVDNAEKAIDNSLLELEKNSYKNLKEANKAKQKTSKVKQEA